MAQKVITVTGFSPHDVQLRELDFPQITLALNEGYEVKKIKQITLPAANTRLNYLIVFVLEKK